MVVHAVSLSEMRFRHLKSFGTQSSSRATVAARHADSFRTCLEPVRTRPASFWVAVVCLIQGRPRLAGASCWMLAEEAALRERRSRTYLIIIGTIIILV